MKHEGWAPVDVPPDRSGLLESYEHLLTTKGAALGVVSADDVPRVRERHLMDGLRGASLLPDGTRRIVDLGSGGGIPGVPIAIVRPDVDVVLTEVRRARVAFLELVIDELRLVNARVHAGPVEEVPAGFDACLARAFAPPAAAWRAASRLLRPGGVLLYWAGARFDPDRDVPRDAVARVPSTDPLAYGGPVVIMSAR